MHRRDLLKQIALGIGMVVSTTELTFLASLSQDKTKSWLPSAFTQQDLPTLKAILALMLPSSSTLGADDIELYRFVDHCFAKLLSTEQQTIALNAFSRYRNEHAQLQEADVKKLDAIAFSQVTNETLGSYESVIRFVYKRLKEYALLGYFSNERVLKQQLDFHFIPGEYQGDIEADESTKQFVSINI